MWSKLFVLKACDNCPAHSKIHDASGWSPPRYYYITLDTTQSTSVSLFKTEPQFSNKVSVMLIVGYEADRFLEGQFIQCLGRCEHRPYVTCRLCHYITDEALEPVCPHVTVHVYLCMCVRRHVSSVWGADGGQGQQSWSRSR